MKDETEHALKSMKYEKATGPDIVSVKMIEAQEEIEINKMESIVNKMYNTGTTPKSLSRSIFITLPKRVGTIKCDYI